MRSRTPRRLLAAALSLLAGPAAATSLEEALALAYESNPNLLAGRAELIATDERVPQALSALRPELSAEGQLGLSVSDSAQGSSDSFDRSAGLTVRQNLYSGGGNEAGVSQAESLVGAQRARLIQLEQRVLTGAAQAYLDVWRAEAVLEAARRNEARLEEQLEATSLRLDLGDRVTRTDVEQARARLEGARAETRQAAGDLASARAAYRASIGAEPEALEDPAPLATTPASEREAQSLAAMNPEIMLAEYNLDAARHGVDIAEAGRLPSIDVTGSVGYADNDETIRDRSNASIGLALTAPLFQGGGEFARIREAKSTVRQRRNEVEAAFRDVREAVTRAWETVETARGRVMSLRAQVEAAESALEGTEAEAQQGLRTNLDVLDTQQDLFQAEVDLLSARRDEILASYQLAAAIGMLTAADLGLEVALFDAEAYFERNRTRIFGLGDDMD